MKEEHIVRRMLDVVRCGALKEDNTVNRLHGGR